MWLYLENVSMIMIAWSKWVLVILMWLTAGSVLNFINPENASVIVAAMKKLYASIITKCSIDWSSGFS